jgi:type I restriction enzyme, R subunit
MEQKAPPYLALVTRNFNDKDVDDLIEHFRDKGLRKELFKEYKEIEMLYEIISPDAFLRPFIDNYTTLSSIYDVVRKAYTTRVYVDRAFQKKTNELVQRHIGTDAVNAVTDLVEINAETVELIKRKHDGDGTKVINLIKSIEKIAEENSDDPFLIGLSDRAKAVQESFEDRQTSTQDALNELFREIERDQQRKREQAERGFDSLQYFVFERLREAGIDNAEHVSGRIRAAFTEHPHWKASEAELRELRKKVTFAVYAEMDDLDEVAAIVDALFRILPQGR